ncbi:L-glutamate gamma-semialdehyde dehydrogenase [Lyngbya confervoides]|uniref:L-glutamate gamma-semialdehyde dehydrogenase n=1 Tax=Lyngbya confervoides BDU141951 TaxID=1574623 RepID=A0ABD4T0S8_9CYAN|nr:L-glutamate gamma-semialdehyde dehydrogenase [Lyngbya confervoides]MCM1982016.1 L-glutamate gamma-semialdehyde dehydrogenase [Lyngbya confervoides BDU141951]
MVASAVQSNPYEAATQDIGRRLLKATRTQKNFFAQMRDQMRWEDRMLAWTMENPGLRVQLFRLIDCLPSLGSKAEIADHLREYLVDESVELPEALKGLLSFTQPDSLPGQIAATTFTTAVSALARKYIAGENLSQVLKTIERLRGQKLAFTMDLLGEAVISEAEAQNYLQRYLDTLEALAQAAQSWSKVPAIDQAEGEDLPRVQLSVKLSAFYSQFDPLDTAGSQRQVCDRLRILLRRAKDLGAAIHVDMEQYLYKDLTNEILQDLLMEEEFRQREDIGVTLQAYLQESEADLRRWIDWAKQRGTPVTVRLIKGAYWDQETIRALQHQWPVPVFQDKAATDANFERLTQLLLENHEVLNAAIGSHNVRSQAHAIAIAQALNIPPRRLELQVLYGMADKLALAQAQEGFRVRVYTPYGELIPGMAYLIRRLLENTANSSFLVQSVGEASEATLLAPPQPHSPAPPPAPQGEFQNAPPQDYSQRRARDLAQQALKSVRQQLGQTYRPLINGQWIETAEHIHSENPANPEEIIGRIQLGGVSDVDTAIAAARSAFPAWKRTPVGDRAALLRRVADLMEARQADLAAWILLETGKPLRESDADVVEAIDFCRYYAHQMEQIHRGQAYDLPGETNRYHYQPRGIAVVLSPWNFPLAIPTGMVMAALVSGNCTILKPSQQSAVIAAKLTELLVEAGVPQGVFQFLPGRGSEVGSALVQNPHVHLITFTGSQEVGCQIYAQAAQLQPDQRHLKRVIAEMGGKNAIIVDESADLDQAVQGVVESAFGYSGQKCSACSRVIVLAPIYDRFLERLIEATRSLVVGPPDHPDTLVGPVIDAAAQARLQAVIAAGSAEATLALAMETPARGYYVGPTLFTGVDPSSVLAQQEFFGPILAVMQAQNFAAALEIANGTRFALTGGLYSRSPSHIAQAQAEFEVGNLYINRSITGAIVNRQPFGGFKLSGVGSKAGGPDYVLQFLEPRTITENVQRQGFAPLESD